MSNKSVCLATLFLSNNTKKTFAKLSEILDNFSDVNHQVSATRMAEVSLDGHTYDEVLNGLVKPILEILDADKESSVFFRSGDGQLATFYMKNRELRVA